MSKSPAKKAPARSKAAAGKHAPAKAAAKTAKPKAPTKSAKAKPASRGSKPSKPVAKSHAKAAAKPASKSTSKPAAKAAPSKPVTHHKPAPKDHPPASSRSPAVATHAPKMAAPKPGVFTTSGVNTVVVSPSLAPQPASSTLPKTSDKPLASPAAATAASRFTERFAPPRPPQRVLPEPVEPVRPAFKADPKLANAWKTKAGRDLSEDELLAMPDGEYMNEKQLEFFRARLQALKDDLLSNAGETTEHLREDTSIVPDPADRATIEEEHALELRTRDRERKLLKKISQSLARIEAGDYGYCDETGEPIGLGRLLARPTATLSLEAQQRRELKQKMFGD
ncbi:MAG TPA: RNA polymerase-binding protein DksA [Burkholderiaceae bacterium]|nr:RNA polymerase-binding protein DksA [Burkholderiaceae bacterium]